MTVMKPGGCTGWTSAAGPSIVALASGTARVCRDERRGRR